MKLIKSNSSSSPEQTPTMTATSPFKNRNCVGISFLLLFVVMILMEDNHILPPVEEILQGRTSDLDFDNLPDANTAIVQLPDADTAIVQLREAEDQIHELKSAHETDHKTITDLQKQLAKSKQQMDSLPKTSSNSNSSSVVFDPTNVCSVLPSSKAFSATRLWKEFLPAIFEASKNPLMPPEFQTEEENARLRTVLEETLSPARMRRAVRHMPTFSHNIVKHVMGIVQKRISDPTNNPPLRIAVFGGSVTIGRGCTPGRAMSFIQCAWPQRFELLINQFFGQEIIKVFNLGVGGTNSNTGKDRIKYWMYNDIELSKVGPDVIVNSYSTNDSLPGYDLKWPEDDVVNVSRENIRIVLQNFVRESLQSKDRCAVPPLVVHVDDYLGPQQPNLLGELSYVSAMTQIAKYYDTVGISYGEVVRDIVYQNKSDTTFAGIKDVHYGHMAHQTIAWSVGFATLELLINYCDDEFNASTEEASSVADANKTKEEGRIITKEEMRREKLFLPPLLTQEFLLESATDKFDAALNFSYNTYVEYDCGASGNNNSSSDAGFVDRNPCEIAWISTPGNYDSGAINRFMNKYKTGADGWQPERQNGEGWSNKDGWVATKPNATFGMRFSEVQKDIRTVGIVYLRSYGEKWKDSNARFTVSRLLPNQNQTTDTVVSEQEVAGVFANDDYKYSITQMETMRLSKTVAKGETLDIQVDLISGSHFKIMGMFLCNK